MVTDATVYIDESGDLGYNCGTKWFVLTGIVVLKSDEQAIRATLSSVKKTLNINNIHWREIRAYEKKAYIVQAVAKHEFRYVNILADTSKLDRGKLASPDHVYNYMCRYLLERTSWLLRDTGHYADIVLSSRGTKKDSDLTHYLENRLLNYPDNKIENRFGKVTSKAASTWDMLQLADVCATSTFNAFETNRLGMCTPCFFRKLSPKLYAYNNRVSNYGVKYMAENMRPGPNYFDDKIVCKK